MREWLEYAPVWLLAMFLRWIPRSIARGMCIALALLIYHLHPRLRRVGLRNLELAFPKMTAQEKRRILQGVFASLGRQLAEFCRFPRYTADNVSQVAVYDGFQNYRDAAARGKGVIFLTAHLGGWEISSFVQSLIGYPLNIVIRPLDNSYLNRLVDRYRTMHGNRTFSKQDFARGLLSSLREGETVGILMDTNMTPPQGEFVNFFGVPACTATGIARVVLHTDAAVVPGFGIWDQDLGKYKVCFDPALSLVRTGDLAGDIIANTALFTNVIESYVARYPDQWLWVHRRWKTRPAGEPALYE